MPLPSPQQLTIGDTTVWLHDLSPSLSDFSTAFGTDTAPLSLLSSEQQKKAWIAQRLILREHYGRDISLAKKPTGQPQLQGVAEHVSISHTAHLLALALSPSRVGIDIEQPHRLHPSLIERILTPEEQAHWQGELLEEYAIYWTGKEATYKLFSHCSIATMTEIALLRPSSPHRLWTAHHPLTHQHATLHFFPLPHHLLCVAKEKDR